jgi:diguanylate cyclase (GGDEF)-like protein
LEQSVAARRSTGRPVSVLMMDVNHFKEINDTLGHHHGDLVLQAIGPRLRTLLRDSDTVARLGGDEFAVLLPNADVDRALAIARKLANALHLPFEVGDLTLQVGASIGIATSPDHGSDVETLVQRADVAMFLAKETGSEVEAYSAERDHYSPDRLILAGQLRKALQEGQIVPFYQPSVDLKTGRVSRVEALARWIHPERGVLGAPAFIPLAEQLGLIRPLTLELIGTALMEVRSWMREGLDITVAVNLSTRHLIDTQLPDDIAALLRKHEVAPSRLTLEITESTIMTDTERSQAVLRNLRAMGVGLAIDDFGTGYSSLAYLKRLAVDALKIDKSFVTDMTTDPSNAVIVRSTIELGHNLGLQVVAEGVETEEVRERLVALDCDVAQGYALSKPLPADQLTCWIREYELRHAAREPEPALADDGSTVVLFDPGRRNNHEASINRSSTR